MLILGQGRLSTRCRHWSELEADVETEGSCRSGFGNGARQSGMNYANATGARERKFITIRHPNGIATRHR
jgi:hypothetical protein